MIFAGRLLYSLPQTAHFCGNHHTKVRFIITAQIMAARRIFLSEGIIEDGGYRWAMGTSEWVGRDEAILQKTHRH